MTTPLLAQPRDEYGEENFFAETGFPDGLLDRNVDGNGKALTNLKAISTLTEIDVTGLGAYRDGTHPAETIAAVAAAEALLAERGGGIVKFPGPGLYNLAGKNFYFTNPNITWQGGQKGPFFFTGNPAVVAQAPTLLITPPNPTDEFLFVAAANRVFEDLAFVYPGQQGDTPVVYPYTIRSEVLGFKLRRCTLYNSYDALRIRNGLCRVENCLIFGLHNSFYLDRVADVSWFERINGGTGYPLSGVLVTWMLANRVEWKIRRADDFRLNLVELGGCNKGFEFADNTDPDDVALDLGGGAYGTIQSASIDSCRYGVHASSTRAGQVGVLFSDFNIGADPGTGGEAAVKIVAPAGGAGRAQIVMVGGAIRGTWAQGAVVQPADPGEGYAAVSQCINYDLPLDAWHAATFQNGWLNFSADTTQAGYQKYLKGMGQWRVRLRGLVKSGVDTPATALWTVPVGYRPAKQEVFIVANQGGVGQVQVWPDGTVRIYAGNNNYLSLDGIEYDA